jgi:hypothetical protein
MTRRFRNKNIWVVCFRFTVIGIIVRIAYLDTAEFVAECRFYRAAPPLVGGQVHISVVVVVLILGIPSCLQKADD